MFADINGSSTELFKVQAGINNNEAINKGQGDTLYALKNGNVAETFAVDDAVTSDDATNLGQVQDLVGSTLSSSFNNTDFSMGVFRQAIINSGMRFWPEGNTFTAISNGSYFAEMFSYNEVGSTIHTIARSTDTPDNKTSYSAKIDCTTSSTALSTGDYVTIEYGVEGHDFKPFTWSTASTFKFYAKTNSTGIYCVSFRNSGNNQSLVKEFTVSSTNWTQHTISNIDFKTASTTGTWDYTNGLGLSISLCLGAGTTFQGTADTWSTSNILATSNQNNMNNSTANEFLLTQVQLYNSTASIPFQEMHYETELALCQRYYEKSYKYSDEPGAVVSYFTYVRAFSISDLVYSNFPYLVRKRTTPTVILYSYATGDSGKIRNVSTGVDFADVVASIKTENKFTIQSVGSTLTADNYYGIQYTADARL